MRSIVFVISSDNEFLDNPNMNENRYECSVSVIGNGDQLIEPRRGPLASIDGL